MPPQPRDSQSLVEDVARVRTGRKFPRGGYKAALRLAKANGEKVVEDELLADELTETVDQFALSLTNEDFQRTLGMPPETFHSMPAESLLKPLHRRTTSERLNKDSVNHLRFSFVAVRGWFEKTDRLAECAESVPYLLLEYLAGVKEEGQKIREGGCAALEKSVFVVDEP